MKRTFVYVSHTVPPNGNWPLDDLAGRAGRVDVLCRNIQSALFMSHDLRKDTDVILVFHADPANEIAIRIEGANIRRLNPDERSTAARIRKVLRERHPDPWWEEVEPGLHVAPFGLGRVLGDLDGTTVILHKDGEAIDDTVLPDDPVFVLGDHQPLTDNELAVCKGAACVSLGPVWYHGNHVTTIVQFAMDKQQAGASHG